MTDQREPETKDSHLAQLDLAAPAVAPRAGRMRQLMQERAARLRSFRAPTVEQIEERLFLEEYLAAEGIE